ncbi:PIG-L family deacetylase [Cupriavidus sp. 30B13]|uniref:PIG-L family deacetylase n=1 Tax=Cupriavidus sp. 30B13 TaxID=3384241 RepID=UPI003B8FB10E
MPALVVSPHLDDAVFSCGELLAARPGSVVVTVLAGLPPAGAPAPPWDAAAGFAEARQAVLARREEDRAALAMLDAEAVWMPFLDGQYGAAAPVAALAAALALAVAERPGLQVVAPAGIHHSDHFLVHEACARVWAALHRPGTPWLFYEDAIHRRVAGETQLRLSRWRQAGVLASAARLGAGAGDAAASATLCKARAVTAYASQLPLFSAAQLADLAAPERYWRWHRRA